LLFFFFFFSLIFPFFPPPGAILGYSSYGSFRGRAGYAHTVEHSVYVSPRAQGRGLGTALLSDLVARARAAGVHAMLACIAGGNARSVRLHERHGFVVNGTLREVGRKFGRWHDLVLMNLIIGEAEGESAAP
jgi:L-amino acid N-acyltransferase YncA